ncbi:MAG: DUF512 domain-containing protein [Oscillospiraceae bacterium]|jgi:putative radical SAM enzyme (TIGR03279 family)|nr:DUF512 domain-containing protein [Oscillospiraceae bacterium]
MPVIRSVEPRSPARRAGVRPGEDLLAINGHAIADVLDYRFHSGDDELRLRLGRPGGGERTVRLRGGRPLGLGFDDMLMDKRRSCENSCVFCFVDQLPPGCRASLREKDDDSRESFLLGSYISLTNLPPEEQDRLVAMRVSPLRVSVHTTDPALRAAMMRNPKAAGCMGLLRRFAENRITLHMQIVLCPGYNDGESLARTLDDLRSLGPAAESTSIVPVGLTAHRGGLTPLRPVTGEDARAAVRIAARYERVYCSDEMYLLAGLPLPDEAHYRGYPQLENGVGMLTLFRREWEQAAGETGGKPGGKGETAVVTGTAAYPFLSGLLRGTGASAVAADNRFFGGGVGAAGLLAGRDVLRALEGLRPRPERALLPESMFRYGTELTLDDMTLTELRKASGVKLLPVPVRGGALRKALPCPRQR